MTAQVWRSVPNGVYVVRGDERRVEAWSIVRMPFEPRGAMVDLRADLRSALARMHVPDGFILHAVYSADKTGALVDAENVLIYNVGPAALRALSHTGIRFERAYGVPEAPDRMERTDNLHHHAYSARCLEDNFDHWYLGDTIAEFDKVPVTRLDKPGPIWAAIRSRNGPPPSTASEPRAFAVRLTVSAPPGIQHAVASFVKPLLDGVICAFHAHNAPIDESLAMRLAAACDLPPGEVGPALLDQSWAALGSRRLVKPFSVQSVQWNPADDYCLAAEVVLSPEPSPDGSWTLSGTVQQAMIAPQ